MQVRRFKACASQALLVLALAGCNQQGGPSGQTAAMVNGDAITQSELDFELSQSGTPQDRWKELRPAVLQTLIDRKLAVQAAEKSGLDRQPDIILAEQRARDLILVERATQVAAGQLRQPATPGDVEQYLTQHPQVGNQRKFLTVEQLRFETPTDPAMLNGMKAIKTMQDLAQYLTDREIPFQRATTEVDTASIDSPTWKQLLAAASGEPLIQVNGTAAVANQVVGARSAVASGQVQAELARRLLESERVQAVLQQRQAALRSDAKIEYANGMAPKTGGR